MVKISCNVLKTFYVSISHGIPTTFLPFYKQAGARCCYNRYFNLYGPFYLINLLCNT